MEVKLRMNKLPSTLTKNQAIAFAVEAFNNFLNSGNTSYFDISTIEIFYNIRHRLSTILWYYKGKRRKV